MTLVVGIPACSKIVNGLPQQAAPARYGEALMALSGAVPVLLPPVGPELLGVLDRIDGVLLDGSPSNVEPAQYGVTEDLTPGKHDPARDATTLPIARAAVARGMPLLAICRGIQELNVAFGGTLHQKVQTLPGRLDHRARAEHEAMNDPPDFDHLFRMKHMVRASGLLARLVGAEAFMVNSLHEQAIDRPGEGLVVEAVAPDGTIEAVRVSQAGGFALGVQFHPEWHYRADAPSAAIFRAFGEALAAYAGLRRAA